MFYLFLFILIHVYYNAPVYYMLKNRTSRLIFSFFVVRVYVLFLVIQWKDAKLLNRFSGVTYIHICVIFVYLYTSLLWWFYAPHSPFFPNFDLHIYKSFKNDWEKIFHYLEMCKNLLMFKINQFVGHFGY